MQTLLIADDDITLCDLLREYLQNESFQVVCVHTGLQAVQALNEKNDYALLILDVMLPELMGFEVLKRLRTFSNIPVLMLTARGDDIDRILGLELGADDYLPKPCNPRELLARIRAILRRYSNHDGNNTPGLKRSDSLSIGQLTLNRSQRSVMFKNTALPLTSAEFNILDILMQTAGSIVSKEQLTEEALGRKLTAYDRSIDVHISKIRKKLQAIDPSSDLIANIRGAGYQFIPGD